MSVITFRMFCLSVADLKAEIAKSVNFTCVPRFEIGDVVKIRRNMGLDYIGQITGIFHGYSVRYAVAYFDQFSARIRHDESLIDSELELYSEEVEA